MVRVTFNPLLRPRCDIFFCGFRYCTSPCAVWTLRDLFVFPSQAAYTPFLSRWQGGTLSGEEDVDMEADEEAGSGSDEFDFELEEESASVNL